MYKKIFWSIFLILLGTLLILRNLQIIHFDWHDFWQLWPFIIIILGISILPVSDWVKGGVSVAAIIIALALLLTGTEISFKNNNSRNNNGKDWRYRDKEEKKKESSTDEEYTYSEVITNDDSINFSIEIDSATLNNIDFNKAYTPIVIEPKDKNSNSLSLCEEYQRKIKYAEYNMELAAGKFLIGPGQDKNLSCFHNNSNLLHYSLKSSEEKDRAFLSLEIINESTINKIDKSNTYEVSLHTSPSWEFDIETGAASMVFDGKDLKVRKLNIEGGAASMDITIGELEKNVDLNISSGVSTLVIRIPKNAYCEVHTETALNSRKFVGFKKRNDGVFVANAEKSNVSCSINIELTAALSVIRIEQY